MLVCAGPSQVTPTAAETLSEPALRTFTLLRIALTLTASRVPELTVSASSRRNHGRTRQASARGRVKNVITLAVVICFVTFALAIILIPSEVGRAMLLNTHALACIEVPV